MPKSKVLILCTGNSCRSHMAEGIISAAAGDLFEVFSAGSKLKGAVHPLALGAQRLVPDAIVRNNAAAGRRIDT